MAGRSISDRHRAWLTEEVPHWTADGLLTQEQASRLLDVYETSSDAAERRRSTATITLMALSATLVGLAVLLVIGYNWDGMSAAVKLAIIFVAIAATYAGAFHVRYRGNARLLSEVLFLLGGLFYGCAIWLIAQIFHIESHYPDGLWFWAVGLLPLVLCLDGLLLHFLFAGLLALWVGTEVLGFGRPIPWLYWLGWHVADGAYSLPLLVLPGLLWSYRKRSSAAVWLYVPLLTWWVVLQPVAWHWYNQTGYVIGAAGALLLLIAELHRAGSVMAIPYRLYGALLLAGALVPLGFADFHRHLLHDSNTNEGLVVAVAIVLAGLIVLAIKIVTKDSLGRQPSESSDDSRHALLRRWVPASLLILMAGLALWHAAFGKPYEFGADQRIASADGLIVWLPTLAVNAAMVVLAFWLMHVGLSEDRARPFAGGVITFLLWAVLRYADLFGEAGGMLGAAAIFFACGLALFGVAWFWRHRKETAHD